MRTRTARRHLTLITAALLLVAGCTAKRPVTLYLPAEEGLQPVAARVEDDPRALIYALTDAGALPEADWSYLYCACDTEDYALDGESRARVVVRLDIADPLGEALRGMADERPAVQALVNSFLDLYGAELLVLTVEGVNLQTRRAYYDHGIVRDEYVKTAGE